MLVNRHPCLTANSFAYSFPLMRYGERLKAARTHAKLTQARLAELCDVQQPTISELENTDATGSSHSARFARHCGVSTDWLADEIGEMIPRYEAVSDSVELAALRLLRQMPAPYRAQAVKQLDSLAELANQLTAGRANG